MTNTRLSWLDKKRSALRQMPAMDKVTLICFSSSQTSKRPTFQPCW